MWSVLETAAWRTSHTARPSYLISMPPHLSGSSVALKFSVLPRNGEGTNEHAHVCVRAHTQTLRQTDARARTHTHRGGLG